MSLRVVKSFNSTLRRFKVGDEISENEDLGGLTVEGAKAAGLVNGPQVAPAYQSATKIGDDE